MTEIAADEQDLAKALDSVANAASGGDTSSASSSDATTGPLSSNTSYHLLFHRNFLWRHLL